MLNKRFETDFTSEIVKEGNSVVLVPKLDAYKKQPSDYAPSKAPVFYNPVMEFNRDLAVLAIQTHQRSVNREIRICEPLTSTGIRGIRFAIEIQGVKTVLMGDIYQKAFNLAQNNIQLNKVMELAEVKHLDANRLLGSYSGPKSRFDVVDIDPFGSPVPYLDSAIKSLRHNGFLAATATDMAPLCGVHKKACIRKYGGKPLRTEYCHELAVRLLAGCLAAMAAKHDTGIDLVLSYSSDHYARVFTKIQYGAKKADLSVGKLGYILHCFNCLHREISEKPFSIGINQCPECESKMDYAGPLWLGKLFDKQFCESMMKENMYRSFRNSRRISNLLSLTRDEVDAPVTYYVLDAISHKLSLPTPSVNASLNILRKSGFQAYPTHFNSRGVRTDASASTMQNFLKGIVSR